MVPLQVSPGTPGASSPSGDTTFLYHLLLQLHPCGPSPTGQSLLQVRDPISRSDPTRWPEAWSPKMPTSASLGPVKLLLYTMEGELAVGIKLRIFRWGGGPRFFT